MEPAKYSSEFRTKVALEYIKAGDNELRKELIRQKFELPDDLISLWEALFLREFGTQIYKVELARRQDW